MPNGGCGVIYRVCWYIWQGGIQVRVPNGLRVPNGQMLGDNYIGYDGI